MSEKASAPTHGDGLYDALLAEMTRLGRKPSRVEAVAVFNDYLAANAVKIKRKVTKPGPRVRCPIFDLLAKIDGQDLTAITRNAGAKIAKAKQQITEVMPGAAPEAVCAEIELRWEKLKQKFRDPKTQTMMALVNWWGTLGDGGGRTKAAKLDVYQEPPEWKPTASELFPGSDVATRSWFDLGTDIRRKILESL